MYEAKAYCAGPTEPIKEATVESSLGVLDDGLRELDKVVDEITAELGFNPPSESECLENKVLGEGRLGVRLSQIDTACAMLAKIGSTLYRVRDTVRRL